MKYTLQQRVFIYATFVKTDSASETRKIFQQEFQGVSPPHNSTIKNIVNRFRESGTFNDISTEKKRVLTEETLDEICSRLSNSPNKPLHLIAEEMGIKLQTLNTAIRILKTQYKVKIKTKQRTVNQDKKRYSRMTKTRQVTPVTVLSNVRMKMIGCGVESSDNSENEFVLPDDPLQIPDSRTGDFELVTVPSVKSEVKEEIVISDSESDEVTQITDCSYVIMIDEDSLGDGGNS